MMDLSAKKKEGVEGEGEEEGVDLVLLHQLNNLEYIISWKNIDLDRGREREEEEKGLEGEEEGVLMSWMIMMDLWLRMRKMREGVEEERLDLL